VSIVSLEGQILDLVAAHDERELAKLLLDKRARVEEARSILLEPLPALATTRAPASVPASRPFSATPNGFWCS
jgi:hypothetical protein